MEKDRAKKLIHQVMEYQVDLDIYANSYTGNARIDRLLFVARCCPPARIDAYKMAIVELQQGKNTQKYEEIVQKLNAELETNGKPRIDVDIEWISKITEENNKEQLRLEKELSSYKGNFIKESIRIGHDELAQHFYRKGDLRSSIKYYLNSRDYATFAQHVAAMCINVIETSMEMDSFQTIQPYIEKARQTGEIHETRISCASAMLAMENSMFSLALEHFLKLDFSQPNQLWKYVNQRDIAIYGGVCALATLKREDLKIKVLENPQFKQFLELEPQMRELIRASYSSSFKKFFSILNNLKSEMLLDMFLHKHVDLLYENIQNSAIIQYSSPFVSADLHKMAEQFSLSVFELETLIANLISKNQLAAKIDSHNKILRATENDLRFKLYKDTRIMNSEFLLDAKYILLRSKLIKAKITVE